MDEAILAPVPADLLEDALAQGYRRVAFGSMAWEFFRRLSEDVSDDPLPALLYASHAGDLALEVSLAGTYLGWRDAGEAERDPAFAEALRSPLARHDWDGSEGGAWAVYWIVDHLHRLATPIPLGGLSLPSGKRVSPAFIPRGPTRVIDPGPA